MSVDNCLCYESNYSDDIQKKKLYNNMFKYPYLFRKFNNKDNFGCMIEYIESLALNSSYLINCLKLNDKTTTYIYIKKVLNRIIIGKSNYFCRDVKNYIMDFIYPDLDRF